MFPTADLSIRPLFPHLSALRLRFTLQEAPSGLLGSVSTSPRERTPTGAHVRSRTRRDNVKQEANVKGTNEDREKTV